MVTRRPIHEPSQLAGTFPWGSQPAAACTPEEELRHVAERLHRGTEGRLEGAAQGAATDAAPQPPAPNTNLVLSVPEPLPPIRESEVGEGWRGSGPESDKEAGQAVGKERDSNLGKKKGEKETKKDGRVSH